MKQTKLGQNCLHKTIPGIQTRFFIVFIAAILFFVFGAIQFAQDDTELASASPFKTGEKLTYRISFGKFNNAAYAETNVVSIGKIGEKPAVELRSKFRTNDFISAAFYLVDETRTTFVSTETGFPLFVRKTSNISGLPLTKTENYTVSPAVNYDLLSLIFSARKNAGAGSFPLFEDERSYVVNFQNAGSETVLVDAGEFETGISTVSSEYFSERGISDVKVNFSMDQSRIPVLIRFRTAKGEFRAELSSAQYPTPQIVETPTPIPVSTPTPVKPVATPPPYVDNQPLSGDISFKLGETLVYRVTANGQFIGEVTLAANERKLFSGTDSLKLSALVTKSEPGNNILNLNDGIVAQVNPDSLAPQFIELKFTGVLGEFNQTAQFDQKSGTVTFAGRVSPDIPVGTHSLLSLAYAIRSFNLKPSRFSGSPVNDTRVAVFFDDRATVFTLRPSNPEVVTINGRKVPAQMITISTGNSNFDRYNLKLWLSADEKRTPLKFAGGVYQAELISEKIATGRAEQ